VENDENVHTIDSSVCASHSGVTANVTNLGVNIDELKDAVKTLTSKLDEFVQRPTWAVTIIISALSSACCIMATFILYNNFKGTP
jgi:hypothetical protein